MAKLTAGDLFTTPREPEEIIAEALKRNPVAIYAAFSGGDTSLAAAHWMMNNVPGCEVFHANTGIGIEEARVFVRETCRHYGWPLHEIRAKEDCGQDFRRIILKHGFPGPPQHHVMYSLLKERPIRLLVKRAKKRRSDKVMIATGIYKDESIVRMGYTERNISFVGSQMWVNPFYWWPKERFFEYQRAHGIKRSPVAEMLGMSGECLCGAFAHPGEKALIRVVSPSTAALIDNLEIEARAAGHNWGWEDRPPRERTKRTDDHPDLFMPFCRNCEKMDSRLSLTEGADK